MRLILVDNLVLPDRSNLELLDVHPHLGLLSLVAVAGREGHDVRIFDPKRSIRAGELPYNETLYDQAALRILALAPDAVGFTTLGASFLFALRVATSLRRQAPRTPILLGGPHATMLAMPLLQRFPVFDVVVRHEAEATLPAVLAALDRRTFNEIPGITWRDGDRVRATPGEPRIDDLDTLPLLSFDPYPVEELGLDLFRVEAGRGCPYSCTFCSTATFFQRRFRIKSSPRIVMEMDRLRDRYGATHFKLDHDLFTVDREKVAAFCEAVHGRGYRWRVSARVDRVDAELLEMMAGSGCVGLYFGIETGSPRMQRIARKNLDVRLVSPTLDMCQRLGIEATASFIAGYPEETREDLDATLDAVGGCFRRPRGACLPQLHMLTPEPGTAMFTARAETMRFDGYATPFNAALLADGDRDIVEGERAIFATYQYYPGVLPRSEQIFAVDAVDTLRTAGHEVLGYALGFFEGRLAVLIQALAAWTGERGRSGLEPMDVIAFLSERLGPTHHLVSLFRYGFFVSSEASAPGPEGRSPGAVTRSHAAANGDEERYRLAPHSTVFWDLHPCAPLLARIRGGEPGPYPDRDVGERAPWLVRVEANGVRSWQIDAGMGFLLEQFNSPRTCGEVLETIERTTGEALIDRGVFGRLVDMGVLEETRA